jgi:hypothetical protein
MTYLGPVREDVNRYLKWAFVEAANAVCRMRRRYPQRHVSRLYGRIAHRRGHHKAIGAVARHLAEATYWMLSKTELYREPVVHGSVSANRVWAAPTPVDLNARRFRDILMPDSGRRDDSDDNGVKA